MVCPVRHLNLHEYQSKKLMETYEINTQKFEIAETSEEAGRAAKKLGKSFLLTVKFDNSLNLAMTIDLCAVWYTCIWHIYMSVFSI